MMEVLNQEMTEESSLLAAALIGQRRAQQDRYKQRARVRGRKRVRSGLKSRSIYVFLHWRLDRGGARWGVMLG